MSQDLKRRLKLSEELKMNGISKNIINTERSSKVIRSNPHLSLSSYKVIEKEEYSRELIEYDGKAKQLDNPFQLEERAFLVASLHLMSRVYNKTNIVTVYSNYGHCVEALSKLFPNHKFVVVPLNDSELDMIRTDNITVSDTPVTGSILLSSIDNNDKQSSVIEEYVMLSSLQLFSDNGDYCNGEILAPVWDSNIYISSEDNNTLVELGDSIVNDKAHHINKTQFNYYDGKIVRNHDHCYNCITEIITIQEYLLYVKDEENPRDYDILVILKLFGSLADVWPHKAHPIKIKVNMSESKLSTKLREKYSKEANMSEEEGYQYANRLMTNCNYSVQKEKKIATLMEETDHSNMKLFHLYFSNVYITKFERIKSGYKTIRIKNKFLSNVNRERLKELIESISSAEISTVNIKTDKEVLEYCKDNMVVKKALYFTKPYSTVAKLRRIERNSQNRIELNYAHSNEKILAVAAERVRDGGELVLTDYDVKDRHDDYFFRLVCQLYGRKEYNFKSLAEWKIEASNCGLKASKLKRLTNNEFTISFTMNKANSNFCRSYPKLSGPNPSYENVNFDASMRFEVPSLKQYSSYDVLDKDRSSLLTLIDFICTHNVKKLVLKTEKNMTTIVKSLFPEIKLTKKGSLFSNIADYSDDSDEYCIVKGSNTTGKQYNPAWNSKMSYIISSNKDTKYNDIASIRARVYDGMIYDDRVEQYILNLYKRKTGKKIDIEQELNKIKDDNEDILSIVFPNKNVIFSNEFFNMNIDTKTVVLAKGFYPCKLDCVDKIDYEGESYFVYQNGNPKLY